MTKGQIDRYVFDYWLEGKENRPALLFLHGFMGDRQEFDQQIKALSQHFFCVAIDLPAHGDSYLLNPLLNSPSNLSSSPPSSPSSIAINTVSNHDGNSNNGQDRSANFLLEPCYTMPAIVNFLVKFLDQIGIRGCTPVGYSMGGRIALALATAFPQYCDRLILESTSAGLAMPNARRDRLAQDLATATKLAQLTPSELPKFLDGWYHQPIFANLRSHPNFAELCDRRAQNHPLELAKCLYSLSVARQRSLWQDLATIKTPVLLISGALDHKFTQIHQQMAKLLPLSQIKSIPKSGHNVHFEQPQIFTNTLRDFLD